MKMRRPTRFMQAYAWHQAAIDGRNPPRHPDYPECGWFKTKRVAGGPWLPACIWIVSLVDPETGDLVAPETLLCEVDGRETDPAAAWTYLRPIPREEYEALVEARARGGEDPRKKINLMRKVVGPNG